MPRTKPSPGFLIRERHRQQLTAHAVAMLVSLVVLVAVNRRVSPGRIWVGYVALVWLAAFLVHLAVFSRETLASMSSRARADRDG